MDMYERKSKKRLREEQVRVLERSFCASKKLEPERKMRLAAELGVPARQVAVWYQNRRARFRTQSLEHDCAALHRRLDAAAAENRNLTRELHRLRHIIEKTSSSEPVHIPVPNLLDRSQDRDRDPQVFQFDDQELFSFIHGCATTSSGGGGDHDDDNMDDSFFL